MVNESPLIGIDPDKDEPKENHNTPITDSNVVTEKPTAIADTNETAQGENHYPAVTDVSMGIEKSLENEKSLVIIGADEDVAIKDQYIPINDSDIVTDLSLIDTDDDDNDNDMGNSTICGGNDAKHDNVAKKQKAINKTNKKYKKPSRP